MTENSSITPVSVKNLDGYGSAPLSWDRVLKHLEEEWQLQGPGTDVPHTIWLATVSAGGRPHVVPVGAAWLDGAFYFSSGDGTQKSKDLAREPRCSMTLACKGMDISLDGEATKVTAEAKVRRLAKAFAEHGWAPEVCEDAFYHEFSAPSAGPPPWYVYEFTHKTVYGFATAEPYGATRWRL